MTDALQGGATTHPMHIHLAAWHDYEAPLSRLQHAPRGARDVDLERCKQRQMSVECSVGIAAGLQASEVYYGSGANE